MSLNIVKENSNMYQGWITHTWNTCKGACYHDCSYCYMKKWGELKPVRFDEKELKTNLGNGNTIFVGSSCDMWSRDIDFYWIEKTLNHCRRSDNTYLFQSKNPAEFRYHTLPDKSIITTTIETNRDYKQMNLIPFGTTPTPHGRSMGMFENNIIKRKMVTIEPIMDFDLIELKYLILGFQPEQVNIGADTGNNHLPEPSWDKIQQLIETLKEFTKVVQKPNLKRLRMK